VTSGVNRFYNLIQIAFPLTDSSFVGFFGYYLTEQMGESKFTATTVAECFKECDLKPPQRIGPWLSEGLSSNPPRYVKVPGGYRLHRSFKESVSAKLGPERVHTQTSVELRSLESKFPDGPTKAFLQETIDCFEVGANRATILMCWQLIMDHLSELVLQKHLKAFNEKLALVTNKRVKVSEVKSRDDFADIPEVYRASALRRHHQQRRAQDPRRQAGNAEYRGSRLGGRHPRFQGHRFRFRPGRERHLEIPNQSLECLHNRNALTAYHQGDRVSEAVLAYYRRAGFLPPI
jgi:hypothetical protein